MPARTGRMIRKLVMSTCRDPNSFEQFPFEPVLCGTNSEVRPQPARLKSPLDIAAALAGMFENEDVARADDLAFHAADLANPFDATNAVAHAIDMHEDVDGAGDLRAEGSKRQISCRHQHHVF